MTAHNIVLTVLLFSPWMMVGTACVLAAWERVQRNRRRDGRGRPIADTRGDVSGRWRRMWLAVCSDTRCQWDHVTHSPTLARAQLQWHMLETNHRGVMVKVPPSDPQRQAKSEPCQWKRAA